MQIAGSRCAICDRNVGVVGDGTACATCQVVYHRACLEGSCCARCGGPLLTGQDAHVLPSSFERAQRDRPVGVTVMGWLACLAVPVVAIRFLAAFNRPGSDAESETIAIGLLIIILGGMGVGFLRGQPWARRFYLWATPVGLAWRLAQNLTTPSELGWWRFGLGLGVYAFWAFVLTRPRARAYFTRTADQR